MTDFSLQNVKEQLEADTDGSYKSWLLEKLKEHKIQVQDELQRMLGPEEHDRLFSLNRALDAAIEVISKYSIGKNEGSVSIQTGSIETLFSLK